MFETDHRLPGVPKAKKVLLNKLIHAMRTGYFSDHLEIHLISSQHLLDHPVFSSETDVRVLEIGLRHSLRLA
jgi:hypothetical protein